MTDEEIVKQRISNALYCLPVEPILGQKRWYRIFQFFTDWTLIHGDGDTPELAWRDAVNHLPPPAEPRKHEGEVKP